MQSLRACVHIAVFFSGREALVAHTGTGGSSCALREKALHVCLDNNLSTWPLCDRQCSIAFLPSVFSLNFFTMSIKQAMLALLLCMDDELNNNNGGITITPVIKHGARRVGVHEFCRRQKYSEYHHHVQELPETAQDDKRKTLTGNIKCPPNLLFPVSLVITFCPA